MVLGRFAGLGDLREILFAQIFIDTYLPQDRSFIESIKFNLNGFLFYFPPLSQGH